MITWLKKLFRKSDRIDAFEGGKDDGLRHFYYEDKRTVTVCDDVKRLPEFIRSDHHESNNPMCQPCAIAVRASSASMAEFY